jgi:hypothetical protein
LKSGLSFWTISSWTGKRNFLIWGEVNVNVHFAFGVRRLMFGVRRAQYRT